MSFQVTPMFSVPLYRTNLGVLDPIVKSYLLSLEFPHARVGHDGSDDSLPISDRGMHILDKPQCKLLKKQIQEKINHFVHDILDVVTDINFSISSSWINRHKGSEFIEKHKHPNSMISGVYYVDVSENTAPIYFDRNYMYNNLWSETVKVPFQDKNNNQFNTDTFAIAPKQGDLLMFPSHVEHTVPTCESNEYRYSLAFNSFARGKIGTGTTQVKIT